MKKFEYDKAFIGAKQNPLEELNKLGAQGWEVIDLKTHHKMVWNGLDEDYDEVFAGWDLIMKRELENAIPSKSDSAANYIKTYKSE
jgi:hypothetical protein